MKRRLWLGANIAMLLMFAMSVVVQYNDPDPARWMTVYGLALAACAVELKGRTRWWFPTLVAVSALAWAITIEPRVLGKIPFAEMFSAWEMKNAGVEESREMYGLLIVFVWMAVLTIAALRKRRLTQRA